MISNSYFPISSFSPVRWPSATSERNNNPSQQPNDKQPNSYTSDPEAESQLRLPKVSPRLSHWSRARALRSGRKLDRSNSRISAVADLTTPVQQQPSSADGSASEDDEPAAAAAAAAAAGKSIYMVSDGTGWTAEHSVQAALGQFDHCLINRRCSVSTHLFSGIDDLEQVMEIIKQAAKEGAILVYTLADPDMAESVKQVCKLWGVPSTDVLGPITEAISSHLGVTPSGLPRGARKVYLDEDYFRRIEAIEFTIKQDDGALPENLHKADIVLAGVSRTGKTPLSTYLAHKGYKVANVPIVMELTLPRTIFEVDSRKVFGTTINPVVLQTIRRARAKTLGFSDDVRTNYSEMDHVRQELDYAAKIFSQNPLWPVIDVTGRAIEETAAVILRLYHDRKNKCTMPRISKRY